MIAATSVNGAIGIRGVNTLLWHSAADMKFFREHTKGQNVVMGNNTLKSIRHPLKDRTNIVLTKDKTNKKKEGVIYYEGIGDIISNYESFCVIGGEAVYNLFLPVVDEVTLATISLDFEEGPDYAYFPIEKLEQDFFMVRESDVVSDVDTLSGLPISIIYTRWLRGKTNIH